MGKDFNCVSPENNAVVLISLCDWRVCAEIFFLKVFFLLLCCELSAYCLGYVWCGRRCNCNYLRSILVYSEPCEATNKIAKCNAQVTSNIQYFNINI
jgi:hypothetical protein